MDKTGTELAELLEEMMPNTHMVSHADFIDNLPPGTLVSNDLYFGKGPVDITNTPIIYPYDSGNIAAGSVAPATPLHITGSVGMGGPAPNFVISIGNPTLTQMCPIHGPTLSGIKFTLSGRELCAECLEEALLKLGVRELEPL